MENQHRKITGYPELGQAEIDLMNEVKALGPVIESVLMHIQDHLANQPADNRALNATAPRFLALAKTELQTGLMYATRAVAQPELF
jgi:hypothetical protein